MNRKDFGKLVAGLRQDLGWTQAQLAEITEIDEPIISQIERGVKKHFEPEQLVQIADALQLSTLERREFFLASTVIAKWEMVRPNFPHSTSDAANPEVVLKTIEELGAFVTMPAYVIDPYYDFIMVNPVFMALFDVDASMVQQLSDSPLGFNSIHLTFGKGLLARKQMTQNWEAFALTSMRGFREVSMRYRATPYFDYLMKHFKNPAEYPFFDRYWKMAALSETDKAGNYDIFDYNDQKYGHLKYMVAATYIVTAFGELFFMQYHPMQENTMRIFAELAQKHGNGLIRISSWPQKKIPEGKP